MFHENTSIMNFQSIFSRLCVLFFLFTALCTRILFCEAVWFYCITLVEFVFLVLCSITFCEAPDNYHYHQYTLYQILVTAE